MVQERRERFCPSGKTGLKFNDLLKDDYRGCCFKFVCVGLVVGIA